MKQPCRSQTFYNINVTEILRFNELDQIVHPPKQTVDFDNIFNAVNLFYLRQNFL
jgi:hypothetical protein